MSTNQTSIKSSFLHPTIPEQWTFENLKVAQQKKKTLNLYGEFLRVVSGIGLCVGIYRTNFSIKNLTNSNILVGITLIALYSLGNFLKKIADRHLGKLTESQIIDFAIEKLKTEFSNLKTSGKSLQGCVEEVNKAYQLVQPMPGFYRRDKKQTRFLIDANNLSNGQQQELLTAAYKNKIILEFDHFSHYVLEDVKELDMYELKQVFGDRGLKKTHQAFACCVSFLVNRFKEENRDFELINSQLKALSFKTWQRSKIHTLRPTIYFEDADALVIRGNFSEIVDPKDAIDQLASLPEIRQITVEMKGMAILEQIIELYIAGGTLIEFQNELSSKHPGKLVFVESLDDNPIWKSTISI
ncbi:MAG: hypothetical protein H0W88_05550 [Parachlamydiaceae bacterium]|nr:hypothetical protein [Parachlamydiaceae bacterium]